MVQKERDDILAKVCRTKLSNKVPSAFFTTYYKAKPALQVRW